MGYLFSDSTAPAPGHAPRATSGTDADGNAYVINPDGTTTTTVLGGDGTPYYAVTSGTDGKPISKQVLSGPGAGQSVTWDSNGNYKTVDPNGNVVDTDQQNSDAQNWVPNSKQEWLDRLRDVKEATEKLNPVGTPGVDQNAANGRIFGGAGSTDPLFTKGGIGGILNGVANMYGLGGLVNGSGAGGGTGTGAAAAGGTNGSGIDTSPISAAAAASKALQDKFLADYNAAHPGQPPVMSAAQLPPAVQAAMPASVRPGVAQATLVDPTLQAQQRDKQLGLESTIQDAIDGKAPSVAQLQLQQALQTNEANQLGLASKASGGGNVALALRTAANNTGRLNQGASADAALLRAKEIADARAQLGGVLDQTRGGDITLAGKNADLATDVSKANAGFETTARSKDADIQAQIAAANAAATNKMASDQGTLTNTAAGNNLNAALHQQEIDQTAKQNLAKNALDAGGQVITGTVGAADAQAKAVAAAQAAKAAADAKQAAGLGALGTTLASWFKTPSSSASGGAVPTGGGSSEYINRNGIGSNDSPIID